MNKIYALFPMNKLAGKTVKNGLLKALGINILAMLIVYVIAGVTRGIPLVRNLTQNFELVFEKYGILGMIFAVVQWCTNTDVSQIDYLNFDKVKKLFTGEKKMIAMIVTAVCVLLLTIIPAYRTPKKVAETASSKEVTESVSASTDMTVVEAKESVDEVASIEEVPNTEETAGAEEIESTEEVLDASTEAETENTESVASSTATSDFVAMPTIYVKGHAIDVGKTTYPEILDVVAEYNLIPTNMLKIKLNGDEIVGFMLDYSHDGERRHLNDSNHMKAEFYLKSFDGTLTSTVADNGGGLGEYMDRINQLNYEDFVVTKFDSYNMLDEEDVTFSFGKTYKDYHDYFNAGVELTESQQKKDLLRYRCRKLSGATCEFKVYQTFSAGNSGYWSSYSGNHTIEEMGLWNFQFEVSGIKSNDDLDYSHE